MNDDARFDEVVEECRTRIYRAACLLLDDPCEAEDVTQQVFLEDWRGWAGFAGRSSAFTWLSRMLLRVCPRHRRRVWWRFWRPRSQSIEQPELPEDEAATAADDERPSSRRSWSCDT